MVKLNMDMPESCLKCRYRNGFACYLTRTMIPLTSEEIVKKRPDSCPLIECGDGEDD